jgi:succinyl-CoA synthetase beta subunit
MNIHEHQAKAVLKEFGAPVPRGQAAYSAAEAARIAETLGGPVWVVKAQIHAGGRGKAGGVKVVKSEAEVRDAAEELIGKVLVTPQTGPEGKEVRRLLVEEGVEIARELYFSMLVDRATGWPAIICSTEGGMDIEEVARVTPEKILTLSIDPATGIQSFHARKIAVAMGLREKEYAKQIASLLRSLYRAFTEKDMSLLEVNPLIVTKKGALLTLDAKVSFDDNAAFRHPEFADLRDETEEDPKEREAKAFGLSYVALDGDIGCMVNGAGLAMATMDIIKLYGAEPANFLDVGGGADTKTVTAAFKIITRDPNVKGILVNIFGGIMKCDVIAEGVIAAVKETGLAVPLVVRLAGTNEEKGKAILAASGLDITPADDLDDAAQKIVAAVKGVK